MALVSSVSGSAHTGASLHFDNLRAPGGSRLPCFGKDSTSVDVNNSCPSQKPILMKRGPAQIQPIKHSFVTDQVQTSGLILTKRNNPLWRAANLSHDFQPTFFLPQPKDPSRFIIAKDIDSVER